MKNFYIYSDYCRYVLSTKAYKFSWVAICLLFLIVPRAVQAQVSKYEAEKGNLFNGASIKNCASCSDGKYVGEMGGPSNGYFTVNTNISQSGTYTLTLRFSSGDPRTIFVSVNDGDPISTVCFSGEWGVFADKRISVELNEGDNLIRFFNANDYAPDIDHFIIEPQVSPILSFEAEDGSLFGNAEIQQCSSCSGGEQVGNIGVGNGYFSSEVSVSEAGVYTMTLSFSSGDPRSIFISVNGGSAKEVICDSGDWGVVATTEISLDLVTGSNTIRFFNEVSYGPNIDKFEFEEVLIAGESYEAESGMLFGEAEIQECGSCSGGQQVGNIGVNGYFTSEVVASAGGVYTMTLSFSSGDPRSVFVSANNSEAIEVVCNSGDWGLVGTLELDIVLNEGTNVLRFFNDAGFGPNIDKFRLEQNNTLINCTNCEVINFSDDGEIYYDLDKGTTTVFVNARQIMTDAYADLSNGEMTVSSKDYSTRTVTKTAITDEFGSGEQTIISLSGSGLPEMQQIFYTYSNKPYFFTEAVIVGMNVQTNYIAPLRAGNVDIQASGDNRALTVPFDNDTFIRYKSNRLQSNASITSSEVTAIYENNSRNGLIVGSIDQSTWKTGVRAQGSGQVLSELSVWSGYTSTDLTRDKIPHGKVVGNDVRSPKIFFGYFDDWRVGMEEFAKASAIAKPQYIFNWTSSAPLGWNSWGAIQQNLNLNKAKAVADFIASEIPQFRREGTAFVNLDSYWDNMVQGGLEGDFSQLADFAKHCKNLGLTPGIYWAPFVDFGKFNRKVEGSTFNYQNAWTKVNGGYHDLDDGRALDPTHPATKDRINLVIDKFKASGFEMIKIDFIGHAAIEADAFYDPNVTTGMQAFHQGMKYLIDRLDGQMLVYTAISPSMASAPYSHMRRIATDAFTDITETEYTLNSTTYGWWLSSLYDFVDADHTVFRDASIGENRARLTSSVVTGTLVIGDNYASEGPWSEKAKLLLQNSEILELTKDGQAFRPVEGNFQDGASEAFIKQTGSTFYLAVVNYGEEKTFNIPLSRLGMPNGTQCVKELFFGNQFSTTTTSFRATISARDARVFEITVGNSTCSFSLPTDNFKVNSRNVSCPGEVNGRIIVEVADHSYNYQVAITGQEIFNLPDSEGNYNFQSGDMSPGDYEVCFTLDAISSYEQCFWMTIREPGELVVESGRISSGGRVSVSLSGSDRYQIEINGRDTMVYTSGVHVFQLQKGHNHLKVKGDKDCQGIYEEDLYVSVVSAYPNPFTDRLTLDTPVMDQNVQLKIYSIQGTLIMESEKRFLNNQLELDFNELDTGTYILKIIGQKFQETIKIIKE